MLSALLLAGLFAAPITTVTLFLPGTGRIARVEERWRWFGRLAGALVSTAILIGVVVGILALLRVTTRNLEAAAIGLALASLVWLPLTRRWGARGHRRAAAVAARGDRRGARPARADLLRRCLGGARPSAAGQPAGPVRAQPMSSRRRNTRWKASSSP